jgi:hypothetical protein
MQMHVLRFQLQGSDYLIAVTEIRKRMEASTQRVAAAAKGLSNFFRLVGNLTDSMRF